MRRSLPRPSEHPPLIIPHWNPSFAEKIEAKERKSRAMIVNLERTRRQTTEWWERNREGYLYSTKWVSASIAVLEGSTLLQIFYFCGKFRVSSFKLCETTAYVRSLMFEIDETMRFTVFTKFVKDFEKVRTRRSECGMFRSSICKNYLSLFLAKLITYLRLRSEFFVVLLKHKGLKY